MALIKVKEIKEERNQEPKQPKEKKIKEKKVKEKKIKEPKLPKQPKEKKPKKVKEPKAPKAVKLPKISKNTNKTPKKGNSSIMVVLMVTCIVPVVLMMVLGVVSYITASNAIKNQTEESALATVNAMADYSDIVMNVVSSKAAEIISNKDATTYYQKLYKDWRSEEAGEALTSVDILLSQSKKSNTYVYSYSIIPIGGKGSTTLVGAFPEEPWTTFSESEEGKYFLESGKIAGWRGYHEFADEYLLANPVSYGFAYYRKFLQNNTMLVLDISMETVKNILIDMDMGEGSIKAMISADGREIGVEQDKISVADDGVVTAEFYGMGTPEHAEQKFVGQWFYEETKESKEGGVMDVKVDGTKYFYFYSPVGTTGIMLCTLVPQDVLLAQARSIAYLTLVIVIVAAVIALALGGSIARGIRKTLNDVVRGLKKVGAGDLTVEFTTNRNDEFKQLTTDLNQTLSGIRGLIQDTRNFGEQVNTMSGDLAVKTVDINESMKQVMKAVEEVSEGTQNQASETENSNMKMISLAENLTDISGQTEVMEKMADNVMRSVENGNQIMDVLNEKSDTTAAITKELSEEILEVEARSKEIQGIIGVINSIAEQTNLLSLNASIEAARAGEQGRGFAVVAEEIRKLAEQSKDSANQIKKIVVGIAETTNKTSDSAKAAEAMMQEQVVALHDTVSIFQDIREATVELVQKLHGAAESMEQIMKEKEDVGDSLQNIAAISEEAAASVEEINATLSEEMMTITHLAEDAEALKTQMEVMNSSLEKFQV
ncbi:MAG: methyl-accepting chemotaxis protein [Lachnospiraceae bacterium]|nr:methyl-accepting chemotaxis protein [Lachnospiraceae bacterium]